MKPVSNLFLNSWCALPLLRNIPLTTKSFINFSRLGVSDTRINRNRISRWVLLLPIVQSLQYLVYTLYGELLSFNSSLDWPWSERIEGFNAVRGWTFSIKDWNINNNDTDAHLIHQKQNLSSFSCTLQHQIKDKAKQYNILICL